MGHDGLVQQNNKPKVAQSKAKPKMAQTTLNLPLPLLTRLRVFASKEGVSQQSVWITALDEYLTRRAA